jgi:hypothetical protein
MSSLLVFNRVYRLEIQSVMLVFSTSFVKYYPSNLLSGSPPPPPPPSQSQSTVYMYRQCDWEGVGVLSCVEDHILQEFHNLFLTIFRT